MKRIIISLIVVVLIVIGAFALFHKSSKPMTTNRSQTASQNKAPAVNNAVLVTKTDPSLGQYLADPSGKPLYTYNADSKGVSNCMGACLANWPAYVDTGSTSNLPSGVGTIKRSDDGKTQYTYNGMPLYYFMNDSAGHVTGDGVENFSVAKPANDSSSSPSSNSSNSGNSSSSGNAPSSPSYNNNY